MKRRHGPSKKKSTSLVKASITSLTHGGFGVAHVDQRGERRAVFVDRAAPGDEAEVAVDFSTRPARGSIVRLEKPSQHRIEPPCLVADVCGGCDFMHIEPAFAFSTLTDLVRAVLPPAFRSVTIEHHRSPSDVGYRTRVRVHVAARRGKAEAGMRQTRSHTIVRTDKCIVLDARIDRARMELESMLVGSDIVGEASLALGSFGNAGTQLPVCDLSFRGELAPSFFAAADKAVHEGRFAGIRAHEPEAKRPLEIGDSTPWISGADGKAMSLAKGGFAQANLSINRVLAERVAFFASQLAPKGSAAIELYAGAGNLSVLLAGIFTLHTIESSEDACAAARTNLETRGLTAKVTTGDAAAFRIPNGTQVLVLDPPRTGAREVADQLAAASRPPAVVYVSCDPPSLGRDLSILEAAGFDLAALETFEMFPRTSHVETLAVLRKARD